MYTNKFTDLVKSAAFELMQCNIYIFYTKNDFYLKNIVNSGDFRFGLKQTE
jgi:hypothetical protein